MTAARMSWISSLNSSIYVGDVHEHQDPQWGNGDGGSDDDSDGPEKGVL